MTSPATIHVSTACLINNEAQQNVYKRLKMLVINLIRRMLASSCMVLYVCDSSPRPSPRSHHPILLLKQLYAPFCSSTASIYKSIRQPADQACVGLWNIVSYINSIPRIDSHLPSQRSIRRSSVSTLEDQPKGSPGSSSCIHQVFW